MKARRWVLSGGRVLAGHYPRWTWTEAMAGQGELIGFVGTRDDALRWAGRGAQSIDACGGVVVPGFVDSHLHAHGAALERRWLDLRGATSAAHVASLLEAGAPPTGWVLGAGWSDSLWQHSAHRQFLDDAFPDRPVALRRIDAHAWWANATALRAARLDPLGPPPELAGGAASADPDGALTGVLVDKAAEPLKAAIPPLPVEEQSALLREQLSDFARLGLTCIHDMWLSTDGEAAYRLLLESADAPPHHSVLPVRVRAYVDGEIEDFSRWWQCEPHPSPEFFRLQGFKVFADGALGSRGAALSDCYADAAGWRGLLVHERAALTERLQAAARSGLQLAVHAIGDAGATLALDVFASLQRSGANLVRPRLEHAQILSPVQVERLAALGSAAVQPIHAHEDADWAPARLGPRRLPWAYRWRSLIQAGVPLGTGSDFPVAPASPLLGLWAARTRPQSLNSQYETLSPQQALWASTAGAHALAGDHISAGALAPGQWADYVVLSHSPLHPDPICVREARVFFTALAGHPIVT